MKQILIGLLITVIFMTFACSPSFAQLPSQQYVMWKVWAADSSSLKVLEYGNTVFSDRDTVVLEGSDTDTLSFNIDNSRGFFTIWVIPDTANFPVGGASHDHTIGSLDSLSVTYNIGMAENTIAANSAKQLSYIKYLDWDSEKAYYETIEPPLAEYFEFYISHTGEADTSAVIIEIQWQ